jgi:hypothetical protein
LAESAAAAKKPSKSGKKTAKKAKKAESPPEPKAKSKAKSKGIFPCVEWCGAVSSDSSPDSAMSGLLPAAAAYDDEEGAETNVKGSSKPIVLFLHSVGPKPCRFVCKFQELRPHPRS